MGATADPPADVPDDSRRDGRSLEHLEFEQQATEAVLRARPRLSVGRAAFLLVTAMSLYLLAPSLVEVLSAWDQLDDFNPIALPFVVILETLSFACVWLLQSIALRRAQWDAIVPSQLAGNAFSRVVPGGGATSTAIQARMLADAGFGLTHAATAITVQSLMISATVVALPVFVIPGMVLGAKLPGSLVHAAWVGMGVFALMVLAGTLLVATRRPVHALGAGIQRVVNLVRVRGPKLEGLGERLVVERDEIRATMGSRWPEAVGAAVGRWGFEYLVLLLALYALGARPDPWAVLLAFSAAALLSLLPFTPGGLGFVEAGLTATLVAAGVRADQAVAATLLYRLVSFWIPLPIGAVAGWWFRRRYPRSVRAA